MKYKCKECGWFGVNVLRAQNPFDILQVIVGCPDCKIINGVELVCDEPDCLEIATCGFPTRPGYRRTCGEHYRNGET